MAKRALGLGVSCPVPWPSGPPALLLGSFCLYTKFCLEVLRVPWWGRRAQRGTGVHLPRPPRRKGGVGESCRCRRTLRSPASLVRGVPAGPSVDL